MIYTKFNGYSPDGRREYNKGGGILGSIVNIALDVFIPPVGAAMHAVTAVKSAAEGDVFGAVGNAFGAYSVGGGFSDGGFGSTLGSTGEAATGALGDAPMAGAWADPEAAAGGYWGGGAGEIAGDTGYSLGGTFYTPESLPTGSGMDIFQNTSADSAYGGGSTSVGTGGTDVGMSSLTQNTSTGLTNSPYLNTTSTTYSPLDTAVPDTSASTQAIATDVGGGSLGTTPTTLDTNAAIGDTSYSGSNIADNASWNAPTAENINYSTVGGQSTPNMNMSTTSPSLSDKLMSNTAEPSMWDRISGYATNPKNFGTMLKGAGSVYGMYQQQQAADAMAKAAAAQDPFAGQRAQYQQALSQSYTDPMAVYNSPQYQGLNAIFQKQIAARDAAAGRNSQYGARAIEQQNNFMDYLNKYRAGLLQPSGATISPNSAGVQAQIASQNYSSNIPRQLGAAYQELGLSNLFGS